MIGEVQVAVQALSAGISALRAVQGADKALNEAEWKLKLADAMSALADAKFALTAVADRTQDLQAEIRRLEGALKTRGEVIRDGDAYYLKNDEGKPSGTPYCMHCFESQSLLMSVRMATESESHSSCPKCGAKYGRRRVKFFGPDGFEDW